MGKNACKLPKVASRTCFLFFPLSQTIFLVVLRRHDLEPSLFLMNKVHLFDVLEELILAHGTIGSLDILLL